MFKIKSHQNDDYVFSKPSKSRRVWAAVIDLFLTIVCSLVLFLLFYMNVIDVFNERDLFASVAQDQLNTGLFEEKEGSTYPVYVNDGVGDELPGTTEGNLAIYKRTAENYRKAVVTYYLDYKVNLSPDKDEAITVEDGDETKVYARKDYFNNRRFNTLILGIQEQEDGTFRSEYYQVDSLDQDPLTATYYLAEDSTPEEQATFFLNLCTFYYGPLGTTGVYYDALQDYQNETHIKEIDSITNLHTIYSFWISFIPFAFVFFFLIPIFSSYGQTLGKRILKIYVVSRDCEELPRTRIGWRCLFEFFLVSLSICFTFGILSIIEVIYLCLNRNRRSFSDSLCLTAVTDDLI